MSRTVRVPEQDRLKKNFLFFMERRGSDGSLVFKVQKAQAGRDGGRGLVPSPQGSRLTEKLKLPGHSARL